MVDLFGIRQQCFKSCKRLISSIRLFLLFTMKFLVNLYVVQNSFKESIGTQLVHAHYFVLMEIYGLLLVASSLKIWFEKKHSFLSNSHLKSLSSWTTIFWSF